MDLTTDIQIDQIIRSRRRTLAIEIRKDASLVVRVPVRASEQMIQEMLFKKHFWIQRHQQEIRAKQNQRVPKMFREGEEYLFLGESYPLRWVEEAETPLVLQEGTFKLLKRCHARAREYFTDWYREQALLKISERVELFSSRADLCYDVLRITEAASRWGSCSSKGSLNFSWRLILAPPAVLDYVVVHELAHLRELNHSRRFWGLVQSLLPDYELQEQWLKDFGHTLDLL